MFLFPIYDGETSETTQEKCVSAFERLANSIPESIKLRRELLIGPQRRILYE